jgi:DNA-binding IclR family transcriptional regulator
MTTGEASEGRGVQSVEVAARILNVLAKSPGPTMLRDVARQAQVAPAQAHAYLVSLKRRQLVEQDEKTGMYRPGPFALLLGIARMRSIDPTRIAIRAVAELAVRTRLTTALSVWGAFGPTVIYVHEGSDSILINTRVGTVYSITGTATGLVFAAYLPEELVRSGIALQSAEPGNTPRVGIRRSLSAIERQIEQLRIDGYSTIDVLPVPGVQAIAAPIREAGGQVRMVATLIGYARSLSVEPGTEHVRAVVDTARAISHKLGYSED